MPNKKTLILTGLLSILIVGCSENASFSPVQSCTIEAEEIVCPDGTRAPLPRDGVDGRDGINGIDGRPGRDGSIVELIDPCGDDINNPDEVVMVFEDGSILAWYKNLGFSVLQEGIAYRTTDKQKCDFMIVAGEVVEL